MSDDELLAVQRAATEKAMATAHARDDFASNMSRESIVAGLRAVADAARKEGAKQALKELHEQVEFGCIVRLVDGSHHDTRAWLRAASISTDKTGAGE